MTVPGIDLFQHHDPLIQMEMRGDGCKYLKRIWTDDTDEWIKGDKMHVVQRKDSLFV